MPLPEEPRNPTRGKSPQHHDEESLPSERAALPSESAAIPSESAPLASEQAAIPSEQAGIPSESAGIRSEQAGLPSEAAAIPSEQAAIPSERILGKRESDKAPEQAGTKPGSAPPLPLPAPRPPETFAVQPPQAGSLSAQAGAGPGRSEAWLTALRPRTWPAAVSPVLVGVSLAAADGLFAWLPALACVLGALLLQLGANLANDYFDHKKGADTAERLGPPRACASGWLAPHAVLRATFFTLALAVALGAYLVYVGGLPILVIGLAGIAAALLYTGGPRPLGYIGLGDLSVFLFFGFAAVGGTYHVQAAAHGVAATASWVPVHVWLAAVPAGCLVTAILVVNNLRDRASDAAAGKRTLAVLLGARATRVEYAALVCVAYAVPVVVVAAGIGSWGWLVPLLTLPLAAVRIAQVWQSDGAALNPQLGATAQLALWYALLLFAGLVALPPVFESAGLAGFAGFAGAEGVAVVADGGGGGG